jgi:hypothetical protein
VVSTAQISDDKLAVQLVQSSDTSDGTAGIRHSIVNGPKRYVSCIVLTYCQCYGTGLVVVFMRDISE